MKKFALVLVLPALFAFAGPSALQAEIDGMNKKIRPVMMKRDIKGFTKLMKGHVTKDFKYQENGRTMTFDQMVASMKMGFDSTIKITDAQSKTLTLVQKGNIGTCTTRHMMAGLTMGEDKKTHKMVFTGTSIDTFRKEGGKWKMTGMSWKNQKMTMDGKPMRMQ